VPGGASTTDVDGDGSSDGGSTPSEPQEPAIAGEQQPATAAGAPPAGGLSSVRARGQAPPSLGPPTTLDTGFQGTLPFDPANPQPQVAAPVAADPAVVSVFDEGEPVDRKQFWSFIAGGLAVLVGAAVIFHVTRRAARGAF
jgi:hypothetical protein